MHHDSHAHHPRTDDQPTVEMEWGVLGPSGRVWVFGERSDGSPVDQRVAAESFANGTGMELVQRRPGGDWTALGEHIRKHQTQGAAAPA